MKSYSQLIVTKRGKLIFSNMTDYQLSSTISKYNTIKVQYMCRYIINIHIHTYIISHIHIQHLCKIATVEE